MLLDKTFFATVIVVLGIYYLFKYLVSRTKVDDNYQELYNKVLTSEDSKVKGQYDK
jgi:archaellum component FlaF (FlaF/FlaG flagellin family)